MNNSVTNQKNAPIKTFGPYSPLRQVGEFYFLSGHVGMDMAAGTAPADVQAQTKKALENIAQTLRVVGLELDDIVKTTLFLTDMDDFAEVNKVYMAYFSEPRPARSTVGVRELPRLAEDTPLKVEIEAIAKAPCH
jgi:2-iminobutanoate/2-iminopropanoate deaminase